MKKTLFVIGVILLLASGQAFAAQPQKPCGTNSAIKVTNPSPNYYSYVQTTAGNTSRSLTVTSPTIKIEGGCNPELPYVFGNGNASPADELDVAVAIADATDKSTSLPVPGPTLTAIRAAFSFIPASFTLTDPGRGTQTVNFTFTNSSQIPLGDYDIGIEVKPETGAGVGSTTVYFTLSVALPVAVDTMPPDVTIQSPSDGASYYLNASLPILFTAVDPPEGGVGTGIQSLAANISSSNGEGYNMDVSPLRISPTLPVAAGVTVNVAADKIAAPIGSFKLYTEATDGAGHTGSAEASFTVKTKVLFLPPISVPGRQFKAGSTLPIKWTFTDANSEFLPPFSSVLLEVWLNSDLVFQAEGGDGAASIRWDLDESGNATQYITNFPIPEVGNYTVEIFVDDVDGNPASQGIYQFNASTKGGK